MTKRESVLSKRSSGWAPPVLPPVSLGLGARSAAVKIPDAGIRKGVDDAVEPQSAERRIRQRDVAGMHGQLHAALFRLRHQPLVEPAEVGPPVLQLLLRGDGLHPITRGQYEKRSARSSVKS